MQLRSLLLPQMQVEPWPVVLAERSMPRAEQLYHYQTLQQQTPQQLAVR